LLDKGYLAKSGVLKGTTWKVIRTFDGEPYTPPKIEYVDGVRITKCRDGYARGYYEVNGAITARPSASSGAR